jgi:hypothetical protein
MKKPNSIYIHLTDEQVELLKKHFEYVRSEAAQDAPGMLVAQVWDAASFYEGPARMRVGFIEHETAKQFEHVANG